ncbi:hypothetical protein V5P93_000680 [Actinokineospora auranticolor]|uniref:von Hippel-Lindau disease tumor suppressor protein n=1 Tax=Actinokineospora auranticolor TaxID=155976 RepID=A0A2S6GYX7_9PSEU|nr:hypothetical protein [Actinokineospora auranticolor]PPK70439.1 von Hippel-Lindau disease tumor suppressor protein [Actinokineospora auranticolor]
MRGVVVVLLAAVAVSVAGCSAQVTGLAVTATAVAGEVSTRTTAPRSPSEDPSDTAEPTTSESPSSEPTAIGSTPAFPRPSADRSPPSDHGVTITFANLRSDRVVIYWVDFDGREVLYNALNPGESYKQPTFTGHIWIVRDSVYAELGRFAAPGTDGEYTID